MARVDFFLDREHRRAVSERGEHAARLHHHLDVSQDVGGLRGADRRADRQADCAGHRASRREAASPHQRHLMRFRAWGAGLALLLCRAARAPPQTRGLSAAPLVARAYDAILDARFDEVPQLLAAACGPARAAARDDRAPAEACQVLETLALWWRMRLDVNDRSLDQAFGSQVDAALAATEAWVAREPKQGRGLVLPWRQLRRPRPVAQRCAGSSWPPRATASGSRSRSSAPSRWIRRCRTPATASGCISTTPTWRPRPSSCCAGCCSCPGGDRAAGLRDDGAGAHARAGAAQRGRLPAAPRLPVVREGARARARRWPASCARDIRTTPISSRSRPISTTCTAPIRAASLQVWRSLLDAAQGDRVALFRRGRGDGRVSGRPCNSIAWERPTSPSTSCGRCWPLHWPRRSGMEARAHVALGQALDRMGARDEAVAQYKLALSHRAAGRPVPHRRRGARRAAPQLRRHDRAGLSRLSLEGWRALERGALGDASRALGPRSRAAPRRSRHALPPGAPAVGRTARG